MNRNAAGLLTLAIIMSFFAAPGSRDSSVPKPEASQEAPQSPETQQNAKTGERALQNKCKIAADSYQAALRRMLYRNSPAGQTGIEPAECTDSIKLAFDHVQIVLALLPDPTRTSLPLFFDRQIEALQQASQDNHWVFDEALMPWDNKSHPEPSDFRIRREEAK